MFIPEPFSSMGIRYKKISIYFDRSGLLIGVPTTRVQITPQCVGNIEIDNIISLPAPYTTSDIERFLADVLNRCYAQVLTEVPKPCAIARFRGVRSFKGAVKDLGCVSIFLDENGYLLTPMWKDAKHKYAYGYRDHLEITIPIQYGGNALAEAFLEAMKLSPIEPFDQEP